MSCSFGETAGVRRPILIGVPATQNLGRPTHSLDYPEG